jgi:hypothetical protein
MPETTRLAGTIEKWWPEIEGFLQLGVTTARTECYTPIFKQLKRAACVRNQASYEKCSHVAHCDPPGRGTIGGRSTPAQVSTEVATSRVTRRRMRGWTSCSHSSPGSFGGLD